MAEDGLSTLISNYEKNEKNNESYQTAKKEASILTYRHDNT